MDGAKNLKQFLLCLDFRIFPFQTPHKFFLCKVTLKGKTHYYAYDETFPFNTHPLYQESEFPVY